MLQVCQNENVIRIGIIRPNVTLNQCENNRQLVFIYAVIMTAPEILNPLAIRFINLWLHI